MLEEEEDVPLKRKRHRKAPAPRQVEPTVLPPFPPLLEKGESELWEWFKQHVCLVWWCCDYILVLAQRGDETALN